MGGRVGFIGIDQQLVGHGQSHAAMTGGDVFELLESFEVSLDLAIAPAVALAQRLAREPS